MPTYDASAFDPPAPVAHVTLRNPAGGTSASDVVLLDLIVTGAVPVPLGELPLLQRQRAGIPTAPVAYYGGKGRVAPLHPRVLP